MGEIEFDPKGRMIELGDGRVVFVADDSSHPGTVFLAFKNMAGEDTKFSLSAEAYEAFRTLVSDPLAGMPLRTFPHHMQWRMVTDVPSDRDTKRK